MSFLAEVQRKIDEAEDVVPVLVTIGSCQANRWQDQLYSSIKALDLELPSLMVLCYDEDDLPWPLPLSPVVYYFEPGNHKPIFFTYRGTRMDALERDVEKARLMWREGLSFDDASFSAEERELIENQEERLEKELADPKYPSKLKQALSLGREAFRAAKAKGKGLPVMATADQVAERLEICGSCEHYTADDRCTQCGCYMKVKSTLTTASCPIGKWQEVKLDEEVHANP